MGNCETKYSRKDWITKNGADKVAKNGLAKCVYLEKGDFLISRNGIYKLILQQDGNLVLYDKLNNSYWSSNTNNGHTFGTMSNGNAALYDENKNIVWDVFTYNNFDGKNPETGKLYENLPTGLKLLDDGRVYVNGFGMDLTKVDKNDVFAELSSGDFELMSSMTGMFPRIPPPPFDFSKLCSSNNLSNNLLSNTSGNTSGNNSKIFLSIGSSSLVMISLIFMFIMVFILLKKKKHKNNDD